MHSLCCVLKFLNNPVTFLFSCRAIQRHITAIYIKTFQCDFSPVNQTDYKDEADQFYDVPSTWLRKQYPLNGKLPTHLVMFDFSDILSKYKPIARIFNIDIAPQSDSRVSQYVLIFERVDYKQ